MVEKTTDNLKTYNKVFCEVFNVQESVLDECFTFHTVGIWDSISHFTLITELEDTFDVMFDTDDILHFESYLNGIAILKRYGIAFD